VQTKWNRQQGGVELDHWIVSSTYSPKLLFPCGSHLAKALPSEHRDARWMGGDGARCDATSYPAGRSAKHAGGT